MNPDSTAAKVLRRLEPYDLKEIAQDDYRSNSPLREGSNSHGFTLKLSGDEKGTFYDHVTGEGGSLYELAQLLHIEIPSPHMTTLEEYAAAHHVPAQVFRAAKWHETTKQTKVGTFPALGFATATGERWRILGEFKEGKPKFLSPYKYQRCWYGLDRAITIAQEGNLPLVICNGEPSVVVAQYYGVAATCITAGENKYLTDEQFAELSKKWDGDIIIALDNDPTGKAGSLKYEEQLRPYYPTLKLVNLGGKDKSDLADFCGQHGTAANTALATLPLLSVGSTPATETPALKLFSITDMWATQAGIQKAWGGWMLMNNITLIGGVPSVGKSVLMLSIVAGYLRGEWCDGTPVPDSLKGRSVVYCLPEGFGEQTELFTKWGLDPAMLGSRVFIPAVPTPGNPDMPNYIFKLDTEEGRKALEFYCEQVKPGLVVVDGLRAAMSGEESSSGDCEKFLTPFVSLANRYNCVVLMSHHLTKGKEKASQDGEMPTSDWFRGSGHLLAACRSAWIVDQPDFNHLSQRRITLVKASSGPKGLQMAYEMDDPIDGLRFTKSIPMPPPKNKKETARRFVLQMLRRGKMTHDELYRASQSEGLDISEATFRDARVELSNEHKIIQIVEGKVYYWALPAVGAVEDDDEIEF